ncbi:MAG: HAD family hydrolase [Chloroflexi bacterium]|nr:HAD family hydrolase [Chloroflexota bacterium]MDA1146596.1 HAD family hydrolase [Chloroflexota bacterium]MQC82716.1 HAD family phosphatase [Chloroflexota bacterium]
MNQQHAEPPLLPAQPSIVAIDLDGTALDSGGVLRERTRRAIEALIARGIPVAIATARPARGVHKLLGPELFETLDLVHVDGAVIDHRRSDTQHLHPLPEGAGAVIAAAAARELPGAAVVIELEGWEFGADHSLTPEQLWEYNSATPEMVLPSAAALERTPVKIAINGLDASVDQLASVLAAELGDEVRLLPHRVGTFLSVVAPGVGKRSGIARLLGDDPEAWRNAIAFGDDYSDIELLAGVGYGFAMANAAPEVSAAARLGAPSNDADGVAVILERLLGGR